MIQVPSDISDFYWGIYESPPATSQFNKLCYEKASKQKIRIKTMHLSEIPVPIPEWTKQIPSFPTLGYMSKGSIKNLNKIMDLVCEKNGWQVRWK